MIGGAQPFPKIFATVSKLVLYAVAATSEFSQIELTKSYSTCYLLFRCRNLKKNLCSVIYHKKANYRFLLVPASEQFHEFSPQCTVLYQRCYTYIYQTADPVRILILCSYNYFSAGQPTNRQGDPLFSWCLVAGTVLQHN